VREEVYSSVLGAAQKMQPIENARHRMIIRDVNYDKWADPTPDEQKKAILAGATIGKRLVGTVDLIDKASGKVIDSRKQTLAQVPHLTERGTFIFGGNEYAIGHQKRQKAGLYARIKKNGQTEVHANILPGKGVAHRYALDPATGVFSIEIQQAKIPLLPLLKAMGVKQTDLEAAWGPQILHSNMKKANDAVAMAKLFERVVGAKARNEAVNKDQAVIDAFRGMEMDDYVNSRTLKRPAKNLDSDVILDVSKRLLAIAKHEASPDNRDDLYYQSTHGPADLFAERISKDYNRLRSALFRKASMRGNLTPFSPGALSKQINSVFLASGLAQALEEINPGETLDKRSRITSMGEGGLSSLESIPESSRNVQDSYYGLIDPVRTPESLRAGVDVHLTNSVRRGRDGKLYAPYRNLKTGKIELKSSEELADATLSFPGELKKKTKNVLGIRGGKFDYYPREEMEYEVPHFEAAFSPLANLVPMKSASKPHRMAMASRMLTQALPLAEADAPLVQAGIPDTEDESYEGRYGSHYGAVRADKAGRVVSINDNRIKLSHDDGTTSEIPLHNNFVFNRKTMFHQTPVVQVGQTLKPGDLLARSNYTDAKGTTAIGKNLRVGYMAYEGANFEDAICISETAAKKHLRSEHAYQHAKEITPDLKLGKKAFLGVFADKFNKSTLDKLDDGGVIKPGQEVMPGDPLILGIRQRELNQNRLLRGRSSTMMDNTETWDHHSPGIVTDVHRDKKGITVVVKSYAETESADKISGRFGDKGVIAKIIPDAEMPQGEDGKPLDILVNPLGLNSRVNSSQIMEAAFGKIAAQDGQPYKIKDYGGIDDLAATAYEELKKHNMKLTETVYDPRTGRSIPNILVGNRFFMKLHHTSESKGQARATGGYTADDTPAKGGATGCFIGKQRVVTSHGWIRVSAICEKRLGLQARTYCEKLNEWVYRPITDWFIYRVPVTDVLAVDVVGPCEASRESQTVGCGTWHTLYPTKNHEFLLFDGTRKLASELRVGDQLPSWGVVPSKMQTAAMLGTLLGDASCRDHEFRFEHSTKQAAYVEWKRSLFADLVPKTTDCTHEAVDVNSRDGRTAHVKRRTSRVVYLSGPHITGELYRQCYSGPGGAKKVTESWLNKLNGLSVALWVIDDGTISGKGNITVSRYAEGSLYREKFSGSLCTQGFSRSEAELLRSWLSERYGVTCSVGADNRITISSKMCRALLLEVAKWVPWRVIPKSKGTIRRVVRMLQQEIVPKKINTSHKLTKIPIVVTNVRAYRPDKDVSHVLVYDFTVADTHTYCAGPALVSNSKRLSLLDNNALLAHGAYKTMRAASLVRGQRNDDYWLAFMQGINPPTPRVPKVYEKFISHLKGSGVNVVEDGPNLHILALTDKDVDQLAGDREITNGETVKFEKDMEPIEGGLFDKKLTGGGSGNRWAYISLPEPYPSPVMEEPIRRVLGLTQNAFNDVLAGREKLSNGETGPTGIHNALDKFDVDQAITAAKGDIASGRKTRRDDAIRKLKYLTMAKERSIHPRDWMLTKVPVLPPVFRPVSKLGPKQLPMVADANYLYRELLEAKDNFNNLKDKVDDLGDERLGVYAAFKAVTGLGDPIHPKLVEKNVKGLLKSVFGSSPKTGTVQQRLLGATVDMVGRAVVLPNPDLDMDSLGIPEKSAWELYKFFTIRRLRRKGMPLSTAMREVKEQTPTARSAMLQELEARPVTMVRAPVLHKFGVMAFRPRLVKGDAVHVSPLIVKPYTMDFDGDCVQYHVASTDDEVEEAYDKLLPSRNLISPANFKTAMYQPTQEYTGALYTATAGRTNKKPRIFNDIQSVLRAFERGDLDISDPVQVK